MGNEAWKENQQNNNETVDIAKNDTGYYWTLAFYFTLGLFLFTMGAGGLIKSKQVDTWPVVIGKILTTNVKCYGNSGMGVNAGLESKMKYEPQVSYEYEFKGQKFTGKKIGLDSEGDREQEAYNVINRYPVGSEVKVYVNPSHPQEALLKPGASIYMWILMIIGAIPLFFAIAGTIELLIKSSQTKANSTTQ